MRRTAHITLLACLLAFALTGHAIVKPPSWSTDLSEPVSWQQMTIAGTLIVATRHALTGLDAATGTRVWRHESLGAISAENFEEIPGTALVVLADSADDTRIVILDALNGTLVFDSQRENLAQILDKRVLARTGSLLIAGFEVGKPQTTLFLYDIATGKRSWKSDALHSGKSKMMTFLTAVIETTQNISPISSSPVELDDGSFLLAARGKIYRMRADNGSVVWKTSFPWGSPALYLSPDHPTRVFVGAGYGGEEYLEGHQSTYHALNLADGEPVWKEPQTFRGAFNPNVVFTSRGLAISEHTEGKGWLRMLDYETGHSLWGKKGRGIKIKGGVVTHAFSGSQMVITTGYDSAWNDEGTEYYLYVVDLAVGALVQKKPIKVRGTLLATQSLPAGVLYATTHEINVLDTATSKLRNKDVLKSKRAIKATADATTLYAFSQDTGLLHTLDLSTGAISALGSNKVKLQGKDQPMGLEQRGDRIVLIGQQSIVSWTRTGDLLFEAHHPAPTRNALMRGLLYAQAARSAAASFASGVYTAGFAQASNQYDKGGVEHTMTTAFSEGYTQMAEGYGSLTMDYWKAASARFQASAESRDFVFMMVRQDNKRFGLAQVSKDTGQIVSTIHLGKEKQPKYQVDDIGSLVFRQTKPNEIVAYQF
jgi:outer membrane protein assembly factor BamB